MNFHEKMKSLREAAHVSVRRLSQLTEISETGLYKLESGKSSPTLATIELICSALGLTLAEFFADAPPELAPDERRLLEAYKALDGGKKNAALITVEAMRS
jgi:transcriptional regulator with XRE-family HTH domain